MIHVFLLQWLMLNPPWWPNKLNNGREQTKGNVKDLAGSVILMSCLCKNE